MDAIDEMLLALRAIAFPLPDARRVGEYESRCDGVHCHACRSELPGKLLSQADQSVLGGGVCLNTGPARTKSGARCDEDDSSVASFNHCRAYRLGEPEGGVNISGEDVAPGLFGYLLYRLPNLPTHATSCVCEDADWPVFGFNVEHTSSDLLVIAEVHSAVIFTDLGGRGSDSRLIDIEQMQPRAHRFKAFRRCPAYPLGRPCNKNEMVIEFDIHISSYPFSVISGKTEI
jgi:hypothetical protein